MSGLRRGQEAFNRLAEEDPGLAGLLRGTRFDPFYDDARLEDFRAEVARLRALRAAGHMTGSS